MLPSFFTDFLARVCKEGLKVTNYSHSTQMQFTSLIITLCWDVGKKRYKIRYKISIFRIYSKILDLEEVLETIWSSFSAKKMGQGLGGDLSWSFGFQSWGWHPALLVSGCVFFLFHHITPWPVGLFLGRFNSQFLFQKKE